MRSRDPRQRLGLRGEDEAVDALTRGGLEILDRRFRCRLGEIDVVARDRDVVVFVEVKSRTGLGYGRPGESVNRAKRERLARVAQVYLSRHRLYNAACRFDVVEVMVRPGTETTIRHIKDAFRLWPTG